jgi:hypothetical protein
MSQPNTTSQKPKPLSTAEKNLSRWMYLPRSTPSMSETATFTLPMVDLRIASTMVEASFISFFAFFMTLLDCGGAGLSCRQPSAQRAAISR